jgi:hypothetical protein
MSLDAKVRIAYRIDKLQSFNADQLDAFGQSNGRYNAWPYLREHVQNTTLKAGLPPVVVPIYRLGLTGASGALTEPAPAQAASANTPSPDVGNL